MVLTAKDGSADLSIPFLAYYGDWSAPGMLDYALYSMRIPCLTASSLPSWAHTSPAALPIVWAPICP